MRASLTEVDQAVLKAYQEAINSGRRSGEDALAQATGRPKGGVSYSLRKLKSLGLVPRRPTGSNAVVEPPRGLPEPVGEPAPAAPPVEEILSLRQKLTEARAELAAYRENHGEMQSFVHDLTEHIATIPPPEVVYHNPHAQRVSSPVAVVLVATDWHMGAVQEPDEIEGFGEFSPAILRARIASLAEKVIGWTEVHRANYDVDECRLLVTGDLIGGDIHSELVSTNEFPAPVQCVEAGRLLASLASTLSPHYQSLTVDIITADNHGRLTKKPQHKDGGYNTYGYPLAIIAQEMLRQHQNVTVNIHPVEQRVVRVKGRRYLIMHGHQMKGWAGIPYYGVQRKVGMEATKRMITGNEQFDLMVMGHWHAPYAAPTYIIGGSVSGTDAYDHSCGRHSPPTQTSWMVHPKHGEFDLVNWRL